MLHYIMLFTLICIRVGIQRIESSTGGGCHFKEIPNNLDLSKKLLLKKGQGIGMQKQPEAESH